MRTQGRNLTRIVLFLLGLSLILGIAIGAGYTLMRQMRAASAEPGVAVDLNSLEKAALGVYLNLHKDDIETPAGTDSEPVYFTIEPGENATIISSRLHRMGLIRDAELFRLLLRYWGVDAKLEAGDFELAPSMSMAEIITELQTGRLRARTVTIPEGRRAEEVAHLLAAEGFVDQEEFIRLVREGEFNDDFLRDRPPEAPRGLEGFLFPDTYSIPVKATAEEIIRLMLDNFERRVTLEMRKQALDRGLTMYEVLILASIVEREAVIAAERPIIAGVYLNRLDVGMYLEADPTVQYAKGYDQETDRWWPLLTGEDLHTVESPYNTYANPGLPPGPICSPGLASIEAVLNPAETDYFFFVAVDEDGSHKFARTFDEHLANQGRTR